MNLMLHLAALPIYSIFYLVGVLSVRGGGCRREPLERDLRGLMNRFKSCEVIGRYFGEVE